MSCMKRGDAYAPPLRSSPLSYRDATSTYDDHPANICGQGVQLYHR